MTLQLDRTGPATLVLLAVLGLPPSLLGQNAPPPEQPARVLFQQSFLGNATPLAPLRLFGPDAEMLSKPEANGWRITLPPGRVNSSPVGLVLISTIRGDFEITTGFEILRADRPSRGDGVGYELYLLLDSATQDAFSFYRLNRVKEGEGFRTLRMSGLGEERTYQGEFARAASKSGQLRLTRQGGSVAFLAADGELPFRELFRHDLGTADLKRVHLAAFTGRVPDAVDLHIRDLKIQVSTAADDLGPGSIASLPGLERIGWRMVGLILVLLILVIFLGVWLGLKERVQAVQKP